MTPLRVGAVGYLNSRPLVFGLDRSPRFSLRYDVPSECARLLHVGDIDLGLVPSIEYLQGNQYRIVPDLAIASRGAVASVAIFTARPMQDVRSIVMDTSSRTSVALTRVLCTHLFKIRPTIETHIPDLPAMLGRGDAALIIGDNALLADASSVNGHRVPIEKIDLGQAWTDMTGLPFVWAFWAGRADALASEDVRLLQGARDQGVNQPDAIAREYFRDSPVHQAIGTRYLRENIKYHLGPDERAALEMFYRYAAEAGLAPAGGSLRFY
jgi:chorismate dehydratase